MSTTVPQSLILIRAMSAILKTVQLPNSRYTHSFALNTFAYWMNHPNTTIDESQVDGLIGLAVGQCETQEELDALGYISTVGVSEFCPGKHFPWPASQQP